MNERIGVLVDPTVSMRSSLFVVLVAALVSTGCAHDGALRSRDKKIVHLQSQVGTLEEQVAQLSADYLTALQRATMLEEELRQLAGREHLGIERTQDCTVLRLPDHLLFGTASEYITRSGLQVLDRIAEVLGRYPEHEVRIEGHTDDLPISKALKARFPSNWELSCMRAGTVVRYLIYHHKIDPTRFVAVGYAQYRPLGDNGAPEGRAQNRRVEFHVAMAPTVKDLAVEPGHD
jgi:chemotaxis protein MotB